MNRPFYTGVPIEFNRRVGSAFGKGLQKYDENIWERNYQNFTPEEFLLRFNHVLEHLYLANDEIVHGKIHSDLEDHLGHAAAGIAMLIWATENGKLPNKLQAGLNIFQNISKADTVIVEAISDIACENNDPETPVKEDSVGIKILKAFNLKGKS